MPVTEREHSALKKLPDYKTLCKAYEKQGMTRDEARIKARSLMIGDIRKQAYLNSRGLYYPSELTGIADAAYVMSLTNEFVETYRDAPDEQRSSENVRMNIVSRMERDGVEFVENEFTETQHALGQPTLDLDWMVGHIIARRPV